MDDHLVHGSTHPHRWRRVGVIHLCKQDDCERLGAALVQQALGPLNLPATLLEKLQASVYNAITRICAAHHDGDLLVHVLISDHALITGHSPNAQPTIEPLIAPTEPGWGFFLIERRGSSASALGGVAHTLEIYCYQEGQ